MTRLGWAAVRGVHTVGLVTMLGKGQPPTFRFKIDSTELLRTLPVSPR